MKFHGAIAVLLFVYYATIAVVGATLWYTHFFTKLSPSETQLERALLASVDASLVGSGLFYARKLYKDLFAQVVNENTVKNALLATTAYFLFRPLFSVMVASIAVLSSYAFVHMATEGAHVTSGFLVFASLAGVFVAAATGEGVVRLERLGRDATEAVKP